MLYGLRLRAERTAVMKVTFDKQKLLAAITPAAGISQSKNTLASVDGLLFECPAKPKFGDVPADEKEDAVFPHSTLKKASAPQ